MSGSSHIGIGSSDLHTIDMSISHRAALSVPEIRYGFTLRQSSASLPVAGDTSTASAREFWRSTDGDCKALPNLHPKFSNFDLVPQASLQLLDYFNNFGSD